MSVHEIQGCDLLSVCQSHLQKVSAHFFSEVRGVLRPHPAMELRSRVPRAVGTQKPSTSVESSATGVSHLEHPKHRLSRGMSETFVKTLQSLLDLAVLHARSLGELARITAFFTPGLIRSHPPPPVPVTCR